MSDGDQESAPGLAYELQSKMFDQLAGFSLAGAGLSVTLIGSVLTHAPGVKWLAVGEFAVAALAAMAANIWLIESLFKGEDGRARAKIMTGVCTALIGMGMGSLAMSVYLDGSRPAAANPKSSAWNG